MNNKTDFLHQWETVEKFLINETEDVRSWVKQKLIESENMVSSTRPIHSFDTADWQDATVVDVETIASEVVDDGPEKLWHRVNGWFKAASDVLWPAI